MEILLVTGAPDSGKTSTIYDVIDWLRSRGWHIVRAFHNQPFFSPKRLGMQDCEVLLCDARGRKVLIHTATDDGDCVNALKANIDDVGSANIDVLITSCRRFDDWMRGNMCTILGWSKSSNGNSIFDSAGRPILEIPLLRVKYESNQTAVVDWYQEHINNTVWHILHRTPYNL